MKLQDAALVPALAEAGFEYHHADVDHAVLTKWLPDVNVDSNKLPNPASHYVGGWAPLCGAAAPVAPNLQCG